MADAQKLAVRPRSVFGKKVGQLRRAGFLPGVIGGGEGGSTSIETETHGFELGYRRWGGTTLLALEGLAGGEVPALITSVTRHPVTGRLVHVNFQRVSLTEKTRADVPLHFVGESYAVKTYGAVLLHAMERISIEAFPQDIPRRIDVSLGALAEVDDAIHVRDLTIDPKVRVLSDGDDLVVKTMAPRAEEAAPTPAAPAAVEAEPKAEAVKEAPKVEAKKG